MTAQAGFSLARAIGLQSNNSFQLSDIRTRATSLYVLISWLHVPAVVAIALIGHNPWQIPAAVLLVTAIVATVASKGLKDGLTLRSIIAVCLTLGPILFVYAGRGHSNGLAGNEDWQIDYHMYFFAVFAMLVGYVDWRPIAIAAGLTAVHHLILDLFVPAGIFPEEGIDRVVLHALAVVVECSVLFWIVAMINALFARINDIVDYTTRETAEVLLHEAAERERLQRELDAALARQPVGG